MVTSYGGAADCPNIGFMYSDGSHAAPPAGSWQVYHDVWDTDNPLFTTSPGPCL
jgi:hypothetical protein